MGSQTAHKRLELENKSTTDVFSVIQFDDKKTSTRATNAQVESSGKRLADNALVALTLLIAESKPAEKDIICKVIVNRINRENL